MADLQADLNLQHYGTPTKIEVPCQTNDTFFKGAMVFADAANGRAQVSSHASGDRFLGICAKQITTTAQDELVSIYVDGVWGFPVASIAATEMGEFLFVDSSAMTDNPADTKTSTDITEASGDIVLGEILSVHSSKAWVNIGILHLQHTGTNLGEANR